MPTTTTLARSMAGLVAATCLGLALIFGLLVGSIRAGLVIGLVAGGIISFTVLFLDVEREGSRHS